MVYGGIEDEGEVTNLIIKHNQQSKAKQNKSKQIYEIM